MKIEFLQETVTTLDQLSPGDLFVFCDTLGLVHYYIGDYEALDLTNCATDFHHKDSEVIQLEGTLKVRFPKAQEPKVEKLPRRAEDIRVTYSSEPNE